MNVMRKNYLSALVLYVQVGSLFAVFLVKRGFKVDLYEAREGNYHRQKHMLLYHLNGAPLQ